MSFLTLFITVQICINIATFLYIIKNMRDTKNINEDVNKNCQVLMNLYYRVYSLEQNTGFKWNKDLKIHHAIGLQPIQPPKTDTPVISKKDIQSALSTLAKNKK